jgi:signal transduction histidine kinase
VVTSVGSFSSMIIFGLACAMVGRRRPRWLIPFAFLWSGTIIVTLMAYPYFRPVGAFFGLVSVGWLFAAVVVLGRAFRATRNMEYALVMMGVMAIIGYAFVDTASISGVHDRGVLLLLYPQIFLITALAVILFRRLTQSLGTLDMANETLRIRLDEQQQELAKAHAHETVLSTNIAREQERQRLMRDLHDGLSGHIVSIIALAENADERDIEKAAREALDDLRLVIQSLDIGDEDIPVVLAYFRERTALQLRRLGIAMDWSMDRLPAITGVTPGHALALLRILQEAVTNAIKHGPARRITVTGGSARDGYARIAIENDGRNDLPNANGNGLGNMRQRAASLGGEVTLEPLPTGMRLTLSLPASLPAIGT